MTDQWLSSKYLGRYLIDRRNADVKVDIAGIFVPIINVAYSPDGDVHCLKLDTSSEDYRIMVAGLQLHNDMPGTDRIYASTHEGDSVLICRDHPDWRPLITGRGLPEIREITEVHLAKQH